MNLLNTIAKEFQIPCVGDSEYKVWFVRTKAGEFYHDFQANNFIALGWDLLSLEFVMDTKISKDNKKEQIESLYPEEKRPGLILSQIETFYNKMNSGDWVVIPAEGGKEISIGKLGDIQADIKHKVENKEYPLCTYMHKRAVEWIKVVDVARDIYLFKALRAQQTISDISDCRELIFRNLFPVYVSDDVIHLTLQKETSANLNLSQNVELQYNCLMVMDAVASLYGKDEFKKDVTIKTAVGSPGFLELIIPAIPISLISTVFLINYAIGKEKTENGSITGVLAIATKFNELVNDYHNRKKTDAETYLIQMQAEKTKAEADLIKAQAKEINARVDQTKITQSGKTTMQIEEENEKIAMISENDARVLAARISDCSKKIINAASKSGIAFDGKKVG